MPKDTKTVTWAGGPPAHWAWRGKSRPRATLCWLAIVKTCWIRWISQDWPKRCARVDRDFQSRRKKADTHEDQSINQATLRPITLWCCRYSNTKSLTENPSYRSVLASCRNISSMADQTTVVPGHRRRNVPNPKPFSCECGTRFATTNARDQHRRDSPRHASESAPLSVGKGKQPVTSASAIPVIGSKAAAATLKVEAETSAEASSLQCCGRPFQSHRGLLQHQNSSWRHIKPRQASHSSTKRAAAAPPRASSTLLARSGARETISYSPQAYSGGGMDWSICDKDCGWCGSCMDNSQF